MTDKTPKWLADCKQYLKDGETPAQRIERERRDTDAVLTLLVREKEKTAAMEELLRSAHAIAARAGADTAWETFAASIQAMGIGAVTARTYRLPRTALVIREHEASADCWCGPEVDYVDPDTGAKVFVHKHAQ